MSVTPRWIAASAVAFGVAVSGLVVPVGAQSADSPTTPPSPPEFVAGGLVAGLQRGVEGAERLDDLIPVPAEWGPPPADGLFSEDLGRLDVSEADNAATEEEEDPDPVPVARNRRFQTPSGPVLGTWHDFAPEGFGGIAPCAGGYPCGKSQLLPPPRELKCWVTSTEIAVSWHPLARADDYTARLQLAMAGERQVSKNTESTWAVFSGLSPSTRYFIGVNANRGGGEQYYSGVYCTTAVGSPACGAVSANGIRLHWRADERVHRWYVARATTTGQFVDGRSLSGPDLSSVFGGLEDDASYKFYFWWQGSPGDKWIQVRPSTVCATMDPPTAPLISCTAAVSGITVRWDSLEDATSYRVSRGNGWAPSSGLSHEFPNLDPSTRYSIRIQGGNSAGWSDDGDTSCTTALATLPGPTGLSCAATSTAIKLTWKEVEGADRYSVDIQLAEPGSPQMEKAATSESAVFAGLTPATKYWVAVQAVENSTPQQSTGVYCSTLVDIPPPSVICVATSSSIAVYWTRVAGVSRYRAMLESGAWTPELDDTNYEFSPLAPGTLYKVTVQSGDINGWGRGDAVECVTAAAGVVCGESTDSRVVLEWEDRPDASHWYAARTDGGYVDGRMISGQQSTEFTGLSKGTRYVLLLWWYDSEGWHPVMPASECYTKPLATPTIKGSYSGGTTLTIRYDPVDGAQYYEASIVPSQLLGESEESWPARPPGVFPYEFGDWELVAATDDNSYTFYGLTPGTKYHVRLRARRFDTGSWLREAVIEDLEPSVFECAAATSTSITFFWEYPGGSHDWRFMLVSDIDFFTGSMASASAHETKVQFTGLEPNTRYWIVIWRRDNSSDQWLLHSSIPYCHTTPAS